MPIQKIVSMILSTAWIFCVRGCVVWYAVPRNDKAQLITARKSGI